MAYQLNEINDAARRDPIGFMEEGDAQLQTKVEAAAELIISNRDKSPVVLLSGPSGSGKTTTAGMIEAALERRGIHTHTVSMDDYYVAPDPVFAPRTPEGELDFESPEMLDLELLDLHFSRLTRGEEILVPRFDFTRHERDEAGERSLKLGRDEIAIFEGIHALNTQLTARHPEATRLYISARSDVLDGETVRFKRTWMRLTRRAVRDYNFRATDVRQTMALWANIRRGEKLYISPYKQTAHMLLDSSLPYEVSVMASYAKPLLAAVPEENQRRNELLELMAAFEYFVPIDPDTVPAGSLLHEFIG
jgi:uridine kinase